MKVAFALVLLVALVSSQDVERLLIDNFFVGADNQSIQIQLVGNVAEGDDSVVETANISEPGCGSDLLGCGRDMQMEVFTGFDKRRFNSDIFFSTVPEFPEFVAEWSVANPKTSSSETTLQYDGTDNSFNLDINGLGGFDITDGGLSRDIVFTVTTDLSIIYTIEIYDTTGGVCFADLAVGVTPQDYDINDISVDIPLSSFSNGCDMTSVGAIQFILPSFDAVDAIVRRVSVIGDPNPTNSNTPTPTSTRSPEPTLSGTPTRTPTRTPSPSGPCVIECECPSFTCQLGYDRDDDQNTVDYSVSLFVFDDDDDVTTVIYYVDDDDGYTTIFTNSFTTIFTSGFTTIFTSGFTTLFSSGYTSFFTNSFSTFSSFFTSGFTSFTSFSSGFSFSSSSDASVVGASFVMMAVLAVLA